MAGNCICDVLRTGPIPSQSQRDYLYIVYEQYEELPQKLDFEAFCSLVEEKAAIFKGHTLTPMKHATSSVLRDLGIARKIEYKARVVQFRDGDLLRIPENARYILFSTSDEYDENEHGCACELCHYGIATWLEPVEEVL